MIKRTLYFGNPCYLKSKDEQLIVSFKGIVGMEGIEDKTVPIEDTGIVILDHRQITITHALIEKLLANNAALITCNESHHPTGLMLNLNGNTIQSERFKWQIEASEPLKKQLWQQTIKAKIENQATVFAKWNLDSKKLISLGQKVKSGDTENHEGQAAAYYWKNIFPEAWQFYRHREGAPPNNLLNYGYAILRATMARSIVGSGLLPTLGIFHRNRYNAYCLADDLMEPYRPFVDQLVKEIIYESSHIHELTKEIKAKLLSIPTLDVYINGDKSPLMIATQRSSATLVKCFEGSVRKISYPEMKI